VKDLAIVHILRVHLVKRVSVVLSIVKDRVIVHIRHELLVKREKRIVHHLEEREVIFHHVQRVMRRLVILKLGRNVNLLRVKMIAGVQPNFRNVTHLNRVIAMIRHLPFLRPIN